MTAPSAPAPTRPLPSTVRERTIYSVAKLNFEAKALLETGFPLLWVEGEISNLAAPRSGHIYFTLKDERAQIRCAMFRSRHRLLKQPLNAGDQVLVRARMTLYEPRGDMQLTVEHVEPAGEGLLLRAYEELKRNLEAEGLFDSTLKRPVPPAPRRIAVVTSPTGAAIHDILITLRRRWPLAAVTLIPVPVQGRSAAPAITRALHRLVPQVSADLVILGRGGGSLEDLWAFNEENVVRAIRQCAVPVVCGVGHESDVTLADLAADLRGATPTAAATAAVPDRAPLVARFEQMTGRLLRSMRNRLRVREQGVDWLIRRLQHPGKRLGLAEERLQALNRRLIRTAIDATTRRRERISLIARLLPPLSPWARLRQGSARLQRQRRHLSRLVNSELRRKQSGLRACGQRLDLLSPLGVLGRGYATLLKRDGRLVTSIDDAEAGDPVTALVGDGLLECKVEGRQRGEPSWLHRGVTEESS